MNNRKYSTNDYLFLLSILFLGLLLSLFVPRNMFESFTTLLPGTFPGSLEGNELTPPFQQGDMKDPKNSVSDNWWHYPSYQVGSYAQITNNVRYPTSPDDGTCSPPEFCGSFYKPGSIVYS
jgi:ABC-type multidrug transport system permease subunit